MADSTTQNDTLIEEGMQEEQTEENVEADIMVNLLKCFCLKWVLMIIDLISTIIIYNNNKMSIKILNIDQ